MLFNGKKGSGKLIFSAYLVAMSVILSRFLSIKIPFAGMEALRFGVGGLPIIASGFLCGPVFGSLTGAAADILGMLIFPHGPYFPVFTLTSGLTGFFPGFFRYFLDRKRMFIKLFFIIFFTQFFTTVFGVSFFLSRITGIDFEFLFYPRLIVLFIEAPFFSFFLGRLFLIRPDFICFNGKQTKNLSYRSCFADNL